MWFALMTSAMATDLYDVWLTSLPILSTPAERCNMSVSFQSTSPARSPFYIDFYAGRAAPPALGETGNFWVYLDPVTPRVGIHDGSTFIELPRIESRSEERTVFYQRGVGEVYWDPMFFRAILHLPDDPVERWWDVVVNGDPNVFLDEISFADNHDEIFTDCL